MEISGLTIQIFYGNAKDYYIVTLLPLLTKLVNLSKIHFSSTSVRLVKWYWSWYFPFCNKLFHPCFWNQGCSLFTNQPNQWKTTHPGVWNLHSISRPTDWENNIKNCWMKVYPELLILNSLIGALLFYILRLALVQEVFYYQSGIFIVCFSPQNRTEIFNEHQCFFCTPLD